MTPLFAIIGTVLLLLGIYGVHLTNKDSRLASKVTAVGLALIGAICLWIYAAITTPPIGDVDIRIVKETPEGYIAAFRISNTRNCQIEEVDADLVDRNGKKVTVKTNVVIKRNVQNEDIGYVLVNKSNYDINAITFTVKHFCPFGFKVDTELSSIKVSNKDPIPQTTY